MPPLASDSPIKNSNTQREIANGSATTPGPRLACITVPANMNIPQA